MNPNNTLKNQIAASRSISRWTVTLGDALDILARKADESADALVTDPPAGIDFAQHEWDSARGGRAGFVAFLAGIFREVWRVLKPGGHGLVWAFPRTSHWTAEALDTAGFEIRDCLTHVFAAGFAKTHDISKAIDRTAGARRPVVGANPSAGPPKPSVAYGTDFRTPPVLTRPATREARRWEGWGTALRPASEHWWLVRRPLAESAIARQVLATGTGAINTKATAVRLPRADGGRVQGESRTPTNFLLSHSRLCQLPANDPAPGGDGVGCTEDCPVRALAVTGPNGQAPTYSYPQFTWGEHDMWPFRYVPKVRPEEREIVHGLQNIHPTVKTVALMRWLCRLVTPPGGLILDPFAGSGTTGVAALNEGFSFVGIEECEEYVRIARARLRAAHAANRRR